MTEAIMPERPIDDAWCKRLAFRILSVIAAVALCTILSVIFWSAVVVILAWLFLGGPTGQR